MIDWILQSLADRLGVAPPQPGEEITPRIRFEQPWPQWLLVFTCSGSIALICWLYRHEGKASTASKVLLAGLRIALVLLAMFMLSEAVLSVERTGLPYLTILIDDSASQRIADQYEKPEVKTALDLLAAASRPAAKGKTAAPPAEDQTTRLDIAKGLILKDQARLLRELEKQHKVRLYRVSNAAQLLAEVDRPADIASGRRAGAGDRSRSAAKRDWATGSARS